MKRFFKPGLTLSQKLDAGVDRSAGPDACWPWLAGKDHLGYGRLSARRADGRSTTLLAHREAMRAHLGGQLEEGKAVLHKCDTPACCNPAHLAVGSQRENMNDMYTKGRGSPSLLLSRKIVRLENTVTRLQAEVEQIRNFFSQFPNP